MKIRAAVQMQNYKSCRQQLNQIIMREQLPHISHSRPLVNSLHRPANHPDHARLLHGSTYPKSNRNFISPQLRDNAYYLELLTTGGKAMRSPATTPQCTPGPSPENSTQSHPATSSTPTSPSTTGCSWAPRERR